MARKTAPRVLLAAIAIVGGFTLACSGAVEPTQWDDVAEQIEEGAAAEPIGAIVDGSAFNAMLPDDGHDGTSRVFTQEKSGYAEAEYKRDGKTLVTVSISDTRDNPSAREKFAGAAEQVAGYPAVEKGSNASMVLVADRFQVRASSPDLSHADRLAWLGAAHISQLATLQPQ